MMDTSNKIVRYGLKQAFSYIEKNPEENTVKESRGQPTNGVL